MGRWENWTVMNHYQYIFEQAKVGIAICNARENCLEMVNPAFARIHGYEPDELIGRSPKEIFAPECMAELVSFEEGGCGSDDVAFETIHYKKDGTPVDVSVHIALIRDDDGKIVQRIANIHDITERKAIEKKLEFLAQYDVLTGLPNRLLAKERTEDSIARGMKDKTMTALMFVDLDGFKTINDSLGHTLGDEVLKVVSSKLQSCLRETDTISRQGGDEFILILPQIAGKDSVQPVLDKLLREFEKPFRIGEHLLATSISIGIALSQGDTDTFESLLQKADTAMYKAKDMGRNTYSFYTDEMKKNMAEQLKIQNDLVSAIQNNEFILHYQPQFDLEQKQIIGAEALLRWNHPNLGMVPPMVFIPIAESAGLIVQIGAWVIEEACQQAFKWQQEGKRLSIAVNVSPIQFKRGDLGEVVKKALNTSKLEPQLLELELTETAMMHDTDNTLQTVFSLKEIGVQLSIDDFGTGYSSLAYLKRFAVDKLKIDQSFVRDIHKDHEDAAIVQTIIQMAKSLNLKTIAEGVENDQVLSFLTEHGCDEVQGYHFAVPMIPEEFERFYEAWDGSKEL